MAKPLLQESPLALSDVNLSRHLAIFILNHRLFITVHIVEIALESFPNESKSGETGSLATGILQSLTPWMLISIMVAKARAMEVSFIDEFATLILRRIFGYLGLFCGLIFKIG